jgi:hypothetical protein
MAYTDISAIFAMAGGINPFINVDNCLPMDKAFFPADFVFISKVSEAIINKIC